MNCQQTQVNLSLYLYGELDFAQEEELEQHLSACALCERAFTREKAWHATLNSERAGVPLDLLADCRQELKTAVSRASKRSRWWDWQLPLGFAGARWSLGWTGGLAAASFLVFAGFSAARWMDRNGFPQGLSFGRTTEMGVLNRPMARIRDIQRGDNDHVRIIVDQISEREITGRADDEEVRRWLLAAAKDSTDPGIRVDSVEMLNGQDGNDVRDALLRSVRSDPNAAVRLKALEGLRQFSGDSVTRDALTFVLEHDQDPGVRTEAIDVLVPQQGKTQFSPELAGMLQEVLRSEQEDDYVRMRCFEVLRQMKASPDIY
jgi:hypothetical protein